MQGGEYRSKEKAAQDRGASPRAAFELYDAGSESSAGRLFGYAIVAMSGAVTGFLLGGALHLGVAVLMALVMGGLLGWLGRGLVR